VRVLAERGGFAKAATDVGEQALLGCALFFV
jgi:hypothetical protein